MGIFYNWKLVKTVPHLWSDIGQDVVNISDTTGDGGSQMTSDVPDYADLML